ncbi:hypothetical protein [Microvirga sp. Mcv34]|uniref:hypothetical protein n=1 Tax=Microvirga sp. Mcv34 TaxID=2926016 RepID=UPI0021C5833B|nr:hypothetical protein [Microvirga sp. Mcv34]
MSLTGQIIFMPWVSIPQAVTVAGFRFAPIDVKDPISVVGPEMAPTVAMALSPYVDRRSHQIESCTIMLRPRHQQSWNIPDRMWGSARRAAEILALSCLAEQRFMEGHFSPHLNATMFQIIGQRITAGSDQIGLFYPRRGGGLRVGGVRFKDVVFQRPSQVEGTRCEVVNVRLARALTKASRSKSPIWDPIASSLEFFLLGNAEVPELDWESCIMLSAMAFERLLEPAQANAQGVAEALANLWAPYASRTLAQAKRVKPDNKPDFAKVQQEWPLHRKWMKELYEARSSRAHRGPRSVFSQNWKNWQHMVIAAFVYPLAVKLKLANAGLYQLSAREKGGCEALDRLLDSHWGKGWKKDPEWSKILSMAEAEHEWLRIIEEAYDETTRKGEQGS